MEPRDGIQQGGLAAAARADDHTDLSRLDFQGAVVHRHHVDTFRIIDLGDIADADRAFCLYWILFRIHGGTIHYRFSSASARVRHCIILLPTTLTMTDVPQPTKPRVTMPITIGMVTLFI